VVFVYFELMSKSTKKYFIPLFFALSGCGIFDSLSGEVSGSYFGTGLEPSNTDAIPQDVENLSTNLPEAVSLENKFPPIGDQGQYGTCAVWSSGYVLKTALNAIEKNWSAADLAKPSNQTSPKDLWTIIPANKKGSNCNGVAFMYAMEALVESGAASMADVPYDMSKSCDANSSTAKKDPNNKLANYRYIAFNQQLTGAGSKIVGMNEDNFKNYLAKGRPVLIGAIVGDRFMDWSGNSVLSSDYNYDLKRAHGMVLVGYDDSKRAFRARNSWGTNWGDNGSIWIDYDFFLTNFCYEAFVAQNQNSLYDDPESPPVSNATDLLANFAEDYLDPEKPANPRARAFRYYVHNNGSTKILASQRWGIYYMYYNAYNANEYGIIFEGNNMDIEPGRTAVAEMPYEMPNITGNYYLLVYVDPMDVIKENNEDNNFYFITDQLGKPLKFKNGVMQSTPIYSAKVLAKESKPAPVHSVTGLGELNGYTPQEIRTVLNRDKKRQ